MVVLTSGKGKAIRLKPFISLEQLKVRSWHLLVALRHNLGFFFQNSTPRQSQMKRSLLLSTTSHQLVYRFGFINFSPFRCSFHVIWFTLMCWIMHALCKCIVLLHQATRGSCEYCGGLLFFSFHSHGFFCFSLIWYLIAHGVHQLLVFESLGLGNYFVEYIPYPLALDSGTFRRKTV